MWEAPLNLSEPMDVCRLFLHYLALPWGRGVRGKSPGPLRLLPALQGTHLAQLHLRCGQGTKLPPHSLASHLFVPAKLLLIHPPLFQAVRIPGLGTFTVVTEQVASQKNDIVTVERPMFHLAKAIVHNHDLRYDYIDIPGRTTED